MRTKIKPGYEYLDNGWRRKGDRYETRFAGCDLTVEALADSERGTCLRRNAAGSLLRHGTVTVPVRVVAVH